MPSTVTAEATVALKDSPGELIFDPTALPSLTVTVVPAGTTMGGGGAGAATGAGAWVEGAAEELIALPSAEFDGAAMLFESAEPEAELEAVLEAVSAGFFEQATNVSKRKMEIANRARERIVFPSDNRKF